MSQEQDEVTLTREEFDELVNELAELRTEKEMRELNRRVWIESFEELFFWMGIVGAVGVLIIGLYYTYLTRHPAILVIFGGTAILTVMQAFKLKPSPKTNRGEAE